MPKRAAGRRGVSPEMRLAGRARSVPHSDDMAGGYYDERMETLPPDVMRTVQDHRLRWQFRRCWSGSAWYRERFEAAGLTPETFGGLADLSRLPPLSRDQHQYDLAQRVASDTRRDGFLHRNTPNDSTLDLQRGWRADAAKWTYIDSPRQIPSPQRWDTADTRHVAELRASQDTKMRLYDRNIPGFGHTVAYECVHRLGRHLVDDHFLAEILDPKTGAALPDGALGELVVTDLVREAYPLVRYRTGLTRAITRDGCPCGRTTSKVWTAARLRAARAAEASSP
ncbi:MAG: hypothetical protein IT306_15305 [Chloroflexi bacterium]|nr:hypothetical protein [Chloroflexota bacterium]